MVEKLQEIIFNIMGKMPSVKNENLNMLKQFVENVTEEYYSAIKSLGLGSELIFPRPKSDLKEMLKFCVDLSIIVRTSGELPFYSAKLLALWFAQDDVDELFLKEINDFRAKSGIKDALRSFTRLDREVELIQLIFEQYCAVTKREELNPPENIVKIQKKAYSNGFMMEVKYHGCCQCVLLALGDLFGDVHPEVFKSASSMSGGIAQCGDGACGAYSGGVMYMGIHMGRSLENINGSKEDLYRSFAMSQILHDKFIETYGGVTGVDVHTSVFKRFYLLRDSKDKLAFSHAKAHQLVCPTVVGSATRWVAQIMIDEKLVNI